MNTDDTIVAISTPAGRGGLGVVRLSGAQALQIAQSVLRKKREQGTGNREQEMGNREWGSDAGSDPQSTSSTLHLASWRITDAELPDEHGNLIDRVLVSYFRKPHSYTAEDVVEVSCHGSPVVLQFLVGRCLEAGARLAEPGEFTLRAFLNGRIDLTQAEAVRDLIEAQTLYQAQVAAQQMEGAVSHRLAPIKKDLVDLIALLEAGIDFAEDDVSVLSMSEILARLVQIEEPLEQLAQSFSTGNRIRHGLSLAIVGRPNVGKSSLFNCLLKQDRAIVTATPGTTRDLVSETIELEGVPLRFVDTAGIRQAYDEAESIGVRKSYEAAADSDLALLVLNGAEGLMPEDYDLLEHLFPLGKLLLVINKCDLPLRLDREAMSGVWARLAQSDGPGPQSGASSSVPILLVSALKQQGIEELRSAILETALPALGGNRQSQFLTSVRQERLVRESVQALQRARKSVEDRIPHEMLLLDLYSALRPLDAVTGDTTVEDILTNIFSTFCIGK